MPIVIPNIPDVELDYSTLPNNPSSIEDIPVYMPQGYNFEFDSYLEVNEGEQSGRKIGGVPSRNNEEDMKHGYLGNSVGVREDVLGKFDDELFNDFYELINYFATAPLEEVGHLMIEKFKNRSGGTFSNEILNTKVKNSASYINFMLDFGRELDLQLQRVGWDINNVGYITIPLNNRPVFSGLYNKINGLTILLNDTEETQIELLDFEINPITHKWKAKLKVTIKDHFGLDKRDVLTYQNWNIGFAAWWMLQHLRDYQPFETKVIIITNIKS